MEISASQSTRIRIAMLVLFALFMLRSFAQQTVTAEQIIQDIQNGNSISYENATISGDLDFTFMNEKMPNLPKRSKWWNDGGSNSVEETIGVSVSFINCTFQDKVLAYIHDEPSGYTFTADFDKDVTFKDCEFRDDSMWKYSEFDGDADFSGSVFQRETTFKYAEFDNYADFSATRFADDATFKYAEFDDGASFKNAVFAESLNIKYMKARGTFEIAGLDVQDDIDAKYTEINGESFTYYLLRNRK